MSSVYKNKIKNKLMEECTQVYCAIKPSKVITGQVGLIAIRPIPKNTVVFKYVEKGNPIYITYEELYNYGIPKNLINNLKIKYNHDKNGIYFHNNVNHPKLYQYINHSNTPNVTANISKKEYITLKKIKNREELFLDYTFGNKYDFVNFKVL